MYTRKFAEQGHLFQVDPLVKFSNLSEMTLLFASPLLLATLEYTKRKLPTSVKQN